MLDINVRLFGAFKDLSSENHLALQCVEGSAVSQIRQKMYEKLQDRGNQAHLKDLLNRSVFANEQSILQESYLLQCSQELAIIPPVCGG